MKEKETIRISKFLSLILRHEPERVGLKLDDAGWVGVEELLAAVNRNGVALTVENLREIVATSDKKRFAFSDDGQHIRASQGHSVEVDLQYPPQPPPEILYHGTATRFLDGVRKEGLQRMARHDVHLSAETKVRCKSADATASPRCSPSVRATCIGPVLCFVVRLTACGW